MTLVQLYVGAKGTDAVAITASQALVTLLGFGSALGGLRRRQIYELRVDLPEPETMGALEGYLERTFEFWNPNKERCWLRTETRSVEVSPGKPFRSAALAESGEDHLLLWIRGEGAAGAATDGAEGPEVGTGFPRDFPQRLAGRPVRAQRGELYSFLWTDTPSADERRARIERAGAVRNRGEGLLVQPQYQSYRVLLGTLPWPAWPAEGGSPLASGEGARAERGDSVD